MKEYGDSLLCFVYEFFCLNLWNPIYDLHGFRPIEYIPEYSENEATRRRK